LWLHFRENAVVAEVLGLEEVYKRLEEVYKSSCSKAKILFIYILSVLVS